MSITRFHPVRLFLLLLCFGFLLQACQTSSVTTSDGRPMPPVPHAPSPPPDSALVNSVVFRVGARPQDTNNNSYPDLIQVEIYLFSQPYPEPTYQTGTFVFELWSAGQAGVAGASPLCTWRREESAVKRTQSMFGRCYVMGLSLLDSGTDQFPLSAADVTCRFESVDGETSVHAQAAHRLQIGSRSAASALPQ